MEKINKVKNLNNDRQFSMQELQISTFDEMAKIVNEKIAKIIKFIVR